MAKWIRCDFDVLVNADHVHTITQVINDNGQHLRLRLDVNEQSYYRDLRPYLNLTEFQQKML